jgi:hypothetical protein
MIEPQVVLMAIPVVALTSPQGGWLCLLHAERARSGAVAAAAAAVVASRLVV